MERSNEERIERPLYGTLLTILYDQQRATQQLQLQVVRSYNETAEIRSVNDPLLTSDVFHPTSTNVKQSHASLLSGE